MVFYTFVQDDNVPYLIENGDKVILNWNRLDDVWDACNPALRRNFFHFSPTLWESFVLQVVHANHRVVFQLSQVIPIKQ